MALKKAVEQPSGAMAEYWRIRAAHLDFNSDTALVELEGYVSADARKDKTPLVPLVQTPINGVQAAIKGAKGDIRKELYKLVLEQVKFLDRAAGDA